MEGAITMDEIFSVVKEIPNVGWKAAVLVILFPSLAKIMKYTFAFLIWLLSKKDEIDWFDFFGFKLKKRRKAGAQEADTKKTP